MRFAATIGLAGLEPATTPPRTEWGTFPLQPGSLGGRFRPGGLVLPEHALSSLSYTQSISPHHLVAWSSWRDPERDHDGPCRLVVALVRSLRSESN